MKAKRTKRFFRLIVLLVLVCGFLIRKPIYRNQDLVVQDGQTFTQLFDQFGIVDKILLKITAKFHPDWVSNLEPWVYEFSWSYSRAQFFAIINKGPKQKYVRFTVLEGWSIYDVQEQLQKSKIDLSGQYLSIVSSIQEIQYYALQYPFLSQAGNTLSSLEGFLYPETYHLEIGQDPVRQLVKLQLDAFEKSIWEKYGANLLNLRSQIFRSYDLSVSLYDLLILASVIQKEERNSQNQPIIAGIFLNRLAGWMRLDADITLCYWLKQPYDSCPPAVIVQHLDDTENLYNTRALAGLPPTAISSIFVGTIKSLINFQKTDYLFYLHDSQWGIHYANTIQDHNSNKSKYLNGN